MALNPHSSVRGTDVSAASVFRCLKKFGMKPYKANCSQILIDGDDDKRLEFFEIMTDKFREYPALSSQLVFSDECNFYLTSTNTTRIIGQLKMLIANYNTKHMPLTI